MFRNYLLVALRNINRNKVFSFLNILGLALGMACSLLIMLWVNDERKIDKFHEHASRLYSVYQRQYYDGRIEASRATPGLLSEEMKRVLPEVQYATSMAWEEKRTFQAGEKILKEKGNHASADFFKMFSFPLLEGDIANALNKPGSIAVSRKMASDFFGSPQAAMGKTIRYQDKQDLLITAVFENVPESASMKFDYLADWYSFLQKNEWAKQWGNNGPQTYLQLSAGTDAAAFEKKIVRFLDLYNKEQGPGFRQELGIQRYDDIYLHANFSKTGTLEGGRIRYVRLFSIVAFFILLIACINFMNLTTARSVKRSKEIGVRKVIGAFRLALVRQFMGEAVLLAFISIAIAIGIVVLCLPAFNMLTGKEIIFPTGSLSFWFSIIGLALITGAIAGSYQSFFLSSFNPVTVMKGASRSSPGASWFRKGLVVFQFVLSIILIISTIVVSGQIRFIQTTNLGFDRENLIYIPLEGDLTGKYQLFKEKALNMPGIQLVSRISQTPTALDNSTMGVEWEGKEPNARPDFTYTSVGYDFVKVMDIKVLQGRDFSKELSTDTINYILNEQAVRKTGFKDPVGKALTFWGRKGIIVGVVKDFHFNSLHVPVNALILRLEEHADWGNALIKTEPGKTKEALASLEKLCKELNPKFPFTYQFSDEEFTKLYKSEQVTGQLANYFAFLAIFISCLGLLGLAMFTAEQRTKEIGIRKVLGASVTSVFVLLSREFLSFVSIALLIASPLAWMAMSKWLEEYAYHINISWWMFAAAGVLVTVIALATVSFQAIRAALANPVKSLRAE